MTEVLDADLEAIEQLPAGPELTAFLTERFGWQFRTCVQCDLAEPSADFQELLSMHKEIRNFFNELRRHYSERVLVIDDFNKNHPARRKFYREVLGKHEPWLRERSKLRVNFCGMIPAYMEMIMNLCAQQGLYINFDIKQASAMLEDAQGYPTWELEKKIEYVTNMDKQICAFFQAVSRTTFQRQLN